MPSSSFINKS